MFPERVNNTPFCSPEAAVLIPQITAEHDEIMGDKSLVSTLRALLPIMMEDGDTLHISDNKINLSLDPSLDELIKQGRVSLGKGGQYQLHLVNLYGDWSRDRNKLNKWVEVIDGEWSEKQAEYGWKVVQKLTDAFRDSQQMLRCFVNEDRKSTILFTNVESMKQLHLLQYVTPAFFPWYFEHKERLLRDTSPIRVELCLSFSKDSSDEYVRCLNEISKEYDFKSAKIKALLNGFEKHIHEKELQGVERSIRDKENTFNDYQRMIQNLLKERQDLIIRANGLKTIIRQNGEASEIMDYFLQNKSVNLENVDGDTLTYVVTTRLSYWDEDEAAECIDNENSEVYFDSDFSPSDTKLLAEAILVDRTLKVRFCAAYKLYIGSTVEGIQGYGYADDYKTYLPNPHIDEYGCLGDNRPDLNTAALNGEYIAAFEMCVASAGSLAISDPSAEKFFHLLNKDTSKQYIETPDGQILTAREAIQWLKGEKTHE